MEIKILSKSQVQNMIDSEIKKLENRFYKQIERLRKKILELESKNMKGGSK